MNFRILSLILLLGGLIVSFPSATKTFAASIVLQSSQSSLGQSDEYTVNTTLSISVSNGTTYYLRGAFYLSGTNNYCGYTYNGSSYYNGPYTTNNGWTNLLPITIQNSSWSGTLKAKPDTGDSGCSNSGTYNFKIERFTSSGTGSFDSQNEQTITITIPTATPVPTNTPTPIPATNTTNPTATNKPTQIPTVKPSATISPLFVIALATNSAGGSVSSVLGSSISAQPTLIKGVSDKKVSTSNILGLLLTIGGLFVLSSCGILFYLKWKKREHINEDSDE